MESHIHIHGEGIQIIPHAEHVQQNHYPKISGMYEALMSRTLDVGGLNDEERAILRYVEECVPAAF